MNDFDIEKIIREYIDKTLHMSLATVSGNKPWVCEVHFAYDEKLNLYWRSKKDRRHSQEIASNSNVAGNIVQQHEVEQYPQAIYFEGVSEIVEDESEIAEMAGLFIKRGLGDKSIVDEAKRDEGHKFYKVKVTNWYAFGKFGGVEGQKYSLPWSSK
ncbi:MAG: pyridoxamine 5'-phosphate oxidase family protein [bacterium]|nr:pyridoxamine 5'-phosphate oxidase family protein [bacterium]